MNKKQALTMGGMAAASLLMAFPAFAATTATTTTGTYPSHFAGRGGMHKFNGVFGTVSAINGTTITVLGKNGTTYSVDASSATFKKGFGTSATTITIANILVNDTVAVQGTVTGTSVVATTITDGIPEHTAGAHMGTHQSLANATFGTVASVNGQSFTLTRKTRTATTTVTITTTDTTTFKKNGQADTLSDLAVGQRVVVMGVKDSSGNVADATSVNIMVRGAKPVTTTTS